MRKSSCPVFVLMVVGLTAVTAPSEAAPLAQASTPAHESALSNKDVVKLSKLQMDDVIVAKIKQATTVDFEVSTDALIQEKLNSPKNSP